jgi:hypothetical protein
MGSFFKSRTFALAATLGISLALLLPAQAQFWDWGNRPQRQQQRDYNPFGGWFSPRWEGPRDRGGSERQEREDFSVAPGPAQKKPEATTSIVVLGDANADWVAYGLEDAFSEKPEIGIVRKHRTSSGLIRYGDRRADVEWPQAAREIIAAEKPKFIVMMIGNNDRQTIREKVPPTTAKPGAQPKGGAQQAQQPAPPPPAATPAPPPDPADAEQQAPEPSETAEQPPANLTPEQARQAAYGPWEFHTEKWELAYIRRIDATIAALKSAGVPVIWVGLPSQRGTKASQDSSYLNELYRSRAEKAGITYVDIWDGFVDEAGRYSPQGPDYEGQIRRLRTSDGVYFTKFGARKLAHYVEREIERHIANRGLPVVVPMPADPGPQSPNAKPGGPAQRPVAGPVVPLTAAAVAPEELMGGGRAQQRPPTTDATATRVLTKGEAVPAPTGRADDFSWPRGNQPQPTAVPTAAEPAATPAAASAPLAPAPPPAAAKKGRAAPAQQRAATDPSGGQGNSGQPNGGQADAGQSEQPAPAPKPQRRARTNSDVPRPPLSIRNFFR